MEINFFAIAAAAFVTLVVGYIWYHPKVFGTVLMEAGGLTKEQLAKGNMLRIVGLTLVLSLMITIVMMSLSVHQTGAYGMIGGMVTDETLPSFRVFMDDYGDKFRTYKHGALHGLIAGLFFAFPINAINGLFERKSAKYIFIHSGYWIVTLTIMGAIICGWV